MNRTTTINSLSERFRRLDEALLDPRFAVRNADAVRLCPEADDGICFRSDFARDADRILHSPSFSRYMDKTQVFFQVKNDHITRRALHVQLVSRIARTIGRCLGLNEDLIEAIALGHDIGHTPFGHIGEHALSDILEERGCGCFVHNAQSVRVLQKLEKNGKGLNLTLQVLDGILGHNGEIEAPVYEYHPENLTWETLRNNLNGCFSQKGYDRQVFPSTLEGCAVRVADIISYVGRDFEDAETLKIIERDDLPPLVARVLGNCNHDIVRTLCEDIISCSYGKKYLAFSDDVFEAFALLKEFNIRRIYNCEMIIFQRETFCRTVKCLFDIYLDEVKRRAPDSFICKNAIDDFGTEYFEREKPERIVTDYIAGMTDQFFLNQFKFNFLPMDYDYREAEVINQLCRKMPEWKDFY